MITLTEKGRAVIDAMWPAYRAAVMAHFGGKLVEGQAGAMDALLESLRPGR